MNPRCNAAMHCDTYDNSTKTGDGIIDNQDDDNKDSTESSPEEHMKHLAGMYQLRSESITKLDSESTKLGFSARMNECQKLI